MALPPILEGTWEEIKLRDKELAGRFLRVIVDTGKEPFHADAALQSQSAETERAARIKRLRGKYAYVGVQVEDLHTERAADKGREEPLKGEGK